MENVIQVQDVLEQKISLENARSMVLFHKGENFTYFDEGCTRYVYVNEDESKVIKIDKRLSQYDNKWNELENDIYKNANREDRELMVPTSIHNGLIEQDFVEPIKYGGKKLSIKQRQFAISCRNEVGWTEDGRLLCFDLDEFKKY